MAIRTSKYLIRSVLILFCFQLLGVIFVSQESEEQISFEQGVIFQKHSNPSSLTSLFEKTENETEEEKHDKIKAIEILDLLICYTGRISASQSSQKFQSVSQHIQELPLFDFFCTYRI